jgi:hypothetical protein
VGVAATILIALTVGFSAAAQEVLARFPGPTPAESPDPEPTHSKAELNAVLRAVESRLDELARQGVRVVLYGVITGRYVEVSVESNGDKARRLLAEFGDKVRVRVRGHLTVNKAAVHAANSALPASR